MNIENLDYRVKEANKEFYDTVADIYERADGRRTEVLDQWLSDKLEKLSKATEGGILLDLGCGTGVVLRNGSRYFKYTYGIDISQGMLKRMEGGSRICADCSFIPFKDESIDVIVCFSVLHHIYEHSNVFREIYRILKKGGLLYIDHDIDRTFVKRFYPFLKIYRHIFNPAKKYMKLRSNLTKELYVLSEIHSDGIDSVSILNNLKCLGFSKTEMYYHWYGLNNITNKIMTHWKFKRGFAPLARIVVKK